MTAISTDRSTPASTTRTRRWIQTGLLLFLGLYFLDNVLTGRIAFYINERFHWLAWMAAILFTTLGVIRVVDLLRDQPTREAQDEQKHARELHDHTDDHEHDHENDSGHDHDHTHPPSWAVLAVISIPLGLGILVPAKPLGAAAIGTSGISTAIGSGAGGGKTVQFSQAPLERNVLDWVRAFTASESAEEFIGQPADIVGFVYRDVRFDEATQFMVARFVLSCCVADASAIGVQVRTTDAAKFQHDAWVRVKGKFQVQDFEGQPTPVLVAESVELVEQPEHPYLYP